MSHHRQLPVWKAAMDLAVHLEHAVRRFPCCHKYTLGTELRHTAQRPCQPVVRAERALAVPPAVLAQVGYCKTGFKRLGGAVAAPRCRPNRIVLKGNPMFLLTRVALLLALCAAQLAQAAYTVNADGSVTDTTTGLVWDRCVLGNRTSASISCAANTNATYTWANALAQVTTRNTASHLGYSDWRLPNKNELESLVDLSVASGATIDATAFPNTPAGVTWTATTYAPEPSSAWRVNFASGHTNASLKTYDFFVRLVRSGQSLASFDWVGTTSYTAPAPSGSSGPGNITTAVAGGGATCALGSVAYQSANSVGAAPPAGVTFAHGVVNFTTTPSCTAGGTITVTLTYPSPLAAGTQFYKYGPATAGAPSSWYVHPATIVGNTITYTVTDGGVGDSNPTAGQITDPGGPGLPGGGAGGVAGVPTLGQWAMLLMGGLMGLLALRRKRA